MLLFHNIVVMKNAKHIQNNLSGRNYSELLNSDIWFKRRLSFVGSQ